MEAPSMVDVAQEELDKREKRRIWKNIILISLAFLMNFNAFQSLSRLQSSLHKDQGMGVINSSVLYASLVLSCLLVPKLMIAKIGHKWTIPVSFMGYILWMAANGYAVWGTMVPASILVGIAAAPLWTAQCSYFTIIGEHYARLTGANPETVVTRFFGVFFCFFQMSSITGSIISSTILNERGANTTDPDPDTLKYCGAADCPFYNLSNPNLVKPSSDVVWTMLGVYIGIALLAVVLVCVFVDQLPKDLQPKETETLREAGKLLMATVRQLRHKEQLLLIPLTMYSGFEQALFNAEFSKSFISCSIGIWNVGLVTIPFGVVNAFVSFSSGHVAKYTGRLPIFIAAMAMDLCIQFTLMFWMPSPDTAYVLYILAAMWGFTDGIWQTQINALYGVVFTQESEAAFSNYRMWESFGFIIAFAYSNFICTNVKLIVVTCVLFVGMALYFVVEYLIRQRKQGVKPMEHEGKGNDASGGQTKGMSIEQGEVGQGGYQVNPEPPPSYWDTKTGSNSSVKSVTKM